MTIIDYHWETDDAAIDADGCNDGQYVFDDDDAYSDNDDDVMMK